MKKIMFSAVALVAFSFAGMANNSVEKEIESIDLKGEVNENVEGVGDCEAYRKITYVGAVGDGF